METRDSSTSHRGRRRTGRAVVALAVPLGVVASGALVWQASYAAFTDTTDNTANSWQTGSVVLGDNDSNAALFPAGALLDDSDSGERCLTVDYTGSMDAGVTMIATGSGALADDIHLVVERGDATPAGAGDCTGFTPTGTVYDGTLDGVDGGTPLADSWAADGTGSTAPGRDDEVTYRIRWDWVDPATVQQDASATGAFSWVATS